MTAPGLLGPTIRQGYDTCDRCGSGTLALMAFLLPSGRTLTFCNHHARRHYEALVAQGAIPSQQWKVPDRQEVP